LTGAAGAPSFGFEETLALISDAILRNASSTLLIHTGWLLRDGKGREWDTTRYHLALFADVSRKGIASDSANSCSHGRRA